MRVSGFLALSFSFSLLLSLLPTGSAKAESIVAENAWSRATPGQARNGAAFVALSNHGTEDDILLGASADSIAPKVELHTHIQEGNILKMRAVDSIPLPAGQTVTMQPGGLHLMLMGLKAPLGEGNTFTLTLTMEKAGTITIPVTVWTMGATTAASPAHARDQHLH